MQRLAYESDDADADEEAVMGDLTLPLTESLPRVLLEQTARDLALGPVEVAYMTGGRLPIAVYAGFDFALRCVAAVIERPLADHRESFRSAAYSSATVLGDELTSASPPTGSEVSGPPDRRIRDGDAAPESAGD